MLDYYAQSYWVLIVTEFTSVIKDTEATGGKR